MIAGVGWWMALSNADAARVAKLKDDWQSLGRS